MSCGRPLAYVARLPVLSPALPAATLPFHHCVCLHSSPSLPLASRGSLSPAAILISFPASLCLPCSSFLMATQFASLFPPSACTNSEASDFLVGTILGYFSAAVTGTTLLLLALRWKHAQLLITAGTALVLPALSSAAMAIACAVSRPAASAGSAVTVDSSDHVCPSPPAAYTLASAGLALAVTGVGLPCVTAWHTLRRRQPELASDFQSNSWWAAHVLQAEALLFVLLQLGSRTLGAVQASIACTAAVAVLALALLRRPWRADLRWKQWTEALVQCCLFSGALLSATRSLAAAWVTFLLEIALIAWLVTIFVILSLQSLPVIAQLRETGAAPPANASLLVRTAFAVVRTIIGASAPEDQAGAADGSDDLVSKSSGRGGGIGGKGRVRVSLHRPTPGSPSQSQSPRRSIAGGNGSGAGKGGSGGRDSLTGEGAGKGRIRVRADPLRVAARGGGCGNGDGDGDDMEGKHGLPASLPGIAMRSNPLQGQHPHRRDARRSQMAPTSISGGGRGGVMMMNPAGGVASPAGLRSRTLRLTEADVLSASARFNLDEEEEGSGGAGNNLLLAGDELEPDSADFRGHSSQRKGGGTARGGGGDRGGFAFAPVALGVGGGSSATAPAAVSESSSGPSVQLYRSAGEASSSRPQHGRHSRSAVRATRASFARAGISASPTLTRAASLLSGYASPAAKAAASASAASAASAGAGASGSAAASLSAHHTSAGASPSASVSAHRVGAREPGHVTRR